jgi:hypothetical protein
VVTDVAHVGSPEQGIADGVDKHVGIAVAQQAFLMFYLYAAYPQVTAFC